MANYNLGIRVSSTGNAAARQLAGYGTTVANTGRAATTSSRGLNLFQRTLGQVNRMTIPVRASIGGIGSGLDSLSRFGQNATTQMGRLTAGFRSQYAAVAGLVALLTGGSLIGGMIGLNKELQNQELSMAAIINANMRFKDSQGNVVDAQKQFQLSMEASRAMVERFQKDAITSPGTSRDLAEIFTVAVNPALQAGASLERIAELSNLAITTAKITNVDIPQASRDIMQMLTGNAGLEVLLFRQLRAQIGLTAKEFNQLPAPERLERLEKAMRKFATPDAVNAYARSIDGLQSSMQEYLELFLRAFGAPLAREYQKYLGMSVDYLTKNRDVLLENATAYGEKLVQGIKDVVALGRDIMQFYTDNKREIDGFAIGIGSIIVLTNSWRVAQILLNGAMLLNPYAATLAGLALLVGQIITHWDMLRNSALNAIDEIIIKIAELTPFLRGLAFIPGMSGLNPILAELEIQGAQASDRMLNRFAPNMLENAGANANQNAVNTIGNNLANPFMSTMPTAQTQQVAQPGITNPFYGKLGDTNVQVSQNITSSDPVAAGNAAARGIQNAMGVAEARRGGAVGAY